MRDYYEVLGVPKNASQDEIKKAFRRLAHVHHPDKKGGDEKKFKEINEAYQVLSDPKKRGQYDQFGHSFSQNGAPGAGFGGASPFGNVHFDFGDLGGMEDIFGSFFGGGMRSQTSRETNGNDIQIIMTITLKEAFEGIKKDISFRTFIECETCKGVGYNKDKGTQRCNVCGGNGSIRKQHQSFLGSFVRIEECDACFGTGQQPKELCKTCKGKGRVSGTRSVTIKTEGGIFNGEVIKISNKGEAGVRQKNAGNLFVRFGIAPDKEFRMEGDNLIIEKKISLADILKEKKIEIKNADGKIHSITLEPGMDVSDPVVLHNQGVYKASSAFLSNKRNRGDLIIFLKLKTPAKMSKKAKELADQLADELEK